MTFLVRSLHILAKDNEKLAQLDAVVLTTAVEIHLPEVIASAEEIAEAAF